MPRPHRAITGLLALALTSSLLTAVGLTAESDPAFAVDPDVDFAGDPAFDSNWLADSSATQLRTNSFPGSRWVTGTADNVPMNEWLGLDVGGYTVNITKFPGMLTAGVTTSGVTSPASNVTTTWYPSQIQFTGTYAPGVTVTGGDLISSEDTLLRYAHLTSSTQRDLVIGGFIPSGMVATWDPTRNALIVETNPANTGTPSWFGYVITFYRGAASNALYSASSVITTAPVIAGGAWSQSQTFAAGGDMFASVGFYVKPESVQLGYERSVAQMTVPVATTAIAAKTTYDEYLQAAPKPAVWGISGVATGGVTATSHQKAYYRAWTYMVQSYIARQDDWTAGTWNTPATYNQVASPHAQVSCGKPVLKDAGPFNPSYPIMNGVCPWDSLFGMQMLAYLPDLQWGAFDALHGMLDSVVRPLPGGGTAFWGERLPSRFAQTAWVLYEQTKLDDEDEAEAQLEALYPQLKVVLAHMLTHPYWVVGTGAAESSDEHDIEFVASILFDLQFAQKIATVLGETADVTAFQAHANAQLVNLRAWFFSDPNEIYTFYYSANGSHYSCDRATDRWPTGCPSSHYRAVPRPIDVPISILSTLAVPNLPSDLEARVLAYFDSGVELADSRLGTPSYSGFDPSIGSAGFFGTKYPDVSLMALGLLEHGAGSDPYQFIHAMSRDAAYAPYASEYLFPGNGLVANGGLGMVTFSSEQVIDFTLLQNGYSIGTPAASHDVPTS